MDNDILLSLSPKGRHHLEMFYSINSVTEIFFWGDALQGLSGAPGSFPHQLNDEWKDISHQTYCLNVASSQEKLRNLCSGFELQFVKCKATWQSERRSHGVLSSRPGRYGSCAKPLQRHGKKQLEKPHISSKNLGVGRRSGSLHDSDFSWLGRGKLTIRYVPGRDGGELERLVEHLEAGLPLEPTEKRS